MEQKIKFAPNVILIDASYLDQTVKGMSTYFAPLVNRELPEADLPLLLECLSLDAGMQLGDNENSGNLYLRFSSTRSAPLCSVGFREGTS